MSKRSCVKNNIIYDCGFPKSSQEISDIINNLEDIATKWQHKSEDKNKQISDLRHRLEVTEKALELAVGIANIKSNHFWTIKELKEKAEKETKGK